MARFSSSSSHLISFSLDRYRLKMMRKRTSDGSPVHLGATHLDNICLFCLFFPFFQQNKKFNQTTLKYRPLSFVLQHSRSPHPFLFMYSLLCSFHYLNWFVWSFMFIDRWVPIYAFGGALYMILPHTFPWCNSEEELHMNASVNSGICSIVARNLSKKRMRMKI